MAIQILPLLGALSNVAGAAWDLYRRSTELIEGRRDRKSQDSLAKSVDRLEESHLEQARLVSQLSRDLERFAQALQEEVEELRRSEARSRGVAYLALLFGLVSLGALLVLK